MRGHWRLLVAGVLFYAVALVVTLPAALVYGKVRADIPGGDSVPQLYQLDGSVWSGRAGVLQYRGHNLGELHWHLSPLYLVLGRMHAKWGLANDEAYLNGTLNAGVDGSLELTSAQGLIPVSQITAQLPAIPVVATGRVAITIEQLVMEQQHLAQLQGQLTWHQAGIATPQNLSFGDLQIRLQATDAGGMRGVVSDAGGPLQAEGSVDITPQGAYSLDLGLAARSGAPNELASALKMLGRADSRGLYRLKYSGRW